MRVALYNDYPRLGSFNTVQASDSQQFSWKIDWGSQWGIALVSKQLKTAI